MFAQINHVAIISHQYNTLGKFYEAVFGLKLSGKGRPASAITIGDGYAGLNLIPRRDGYVEGIDHFGMVVDDVEPVLERMKRKHKNVTIAKRPSTRPFAAYSGHDPDGNVFDLAQKKNDTRMDLYAQNPNGGEHQRIFNKFAIRLRLFRRQALPIEIVIPHLTGIVEDFLLVFVDRLDGSSHDVLELHVGIFGACTSLFSVSTYVW